MAQVNLRNPATQKAVIVIALAFGVIYAYTNFLFIPRREKAKTLQSEIKKENDLLARGKRIAANFQTVQDAHARLMQSWEVAHDLLPTEREMEGLLKNITLEGQKRNVSFLLFRPLDPVEKPYYWENPIEIRTQSTYHDLGEFLSSVASLDRIVNINNLKLSAYQPNKGRSSHTVTAEFVASIYIFKGLDAPVSNAAAPAAAGDGKTDGTSAAPPRTGKDAPGAKQKEHEA